MVRHIRVGEVSIYVEEGSEVSDRLLLMFEMAERLMVVDGAHREVFITPFVHHLKHSKKSYGLQGPRHLAKLLNVIVDFRSADNDATSVDWKTIEKELITLRKKLYPDD